MTVTQDLSILHLILNASWVVQGIMLLLLAVSVISWYYIFRKMFGIRRARRQTEEGRACLLEFITSAETAFSHRQ